MACRPNDWAVAVAQLTAPPRLDYVIWLFLPFAFVPLLGAPRLLSGVFMFGRNVLSAAANRSWLGAHYSAGVVPAVGFAFIGALAHLPKPWARRAALAALVTTIVCDGFILANARGAALPAEPLPWADSYREALARIPPTAAVAATSQISTYLGGRDRIWVTPPPSRGFPWANDAQYWAWDVAAVEWAVLDVADVQEAQRQDLPASERQVRSVFPADEFDEVYRQGTVIVLRRRTP